MVWRCEIIVRMRHACLALRIVLVYCKEPPLVKLFRDYLN